MRTPRGWRIVLPTAALAVALDGGSMRLIAAGASGTGAPRAGFDQCAVCHSIDGSDGTGPTLKGIGGRASGTLPGFRYSRAMKTANIVWDARTLDNYLSDPQGYVPGNVMPFSGVADRVEREKIVAYLLSLR